MPPSSVLNIQTESPSQDRVTLSFPNFLHTLLYRLFTESCLSLELKPSIHHFYHSWTFPQWSQVPPVNHTLPSVVTDSQICEQTFLTRAQEESSNDWGLKTQQGSSFGSSTRGSHRMALPREWLSALNHRHHPQTLSVPFQKTHQRNSTIHSSRTLAFQSCFAQIQPVGS